MGGPIMNEKIQAAHLQRAAYVYIRQSTAHQVLHHREGQQRQYDLAQRARDLGFSQVVVIDDDLGRSGSGLHERPGFGRLLAAVCRDWPVPYSLWRLHGWRATTETGIIWLICAR